MLHRLDDKRSQYILMNTSLTSRRYAVKKRCTLTWSLSATSIPASRPPLVSRSAIYLHRSITLQSYTGHLIYKCGGIDKRTIEKFEKVRYISLQAFISSSLSRCLPLGGASLASVTALMRPPTFLEIRCATSIEDLSALSRTTSHLSYPVWPTSS
jgi:hypothetical protein